MLVPEKNCPFCGGEPRVLCDETSAYVECTICDASTMECADQHKAVSHWDARSTCKNPLQVVLQNILDLNNSEIPFEERDAAEKALEALNH